MSDNEQRPDVRQESAEVETARERLLLVLRLLAKEVARRLNHKEDPKDGDQGQRLS